MTRAPCRKCCFLDQRGNGCARCWPRWLCADIHITPAGDNPCCDFSILLPYVCDEQAWIGTGTCTDGLYRLDLEVQVVRDEDDNCVVVVTGSYIDGSLTFDTDDPNGVTFDLSDGPAGDGYEVTLSLPRVVGNPVIDDENSPCACANCLPEIICVGVNGPPYAFSFPGDPIVVPCSCEQYHAFMFDCDARAWVGPPVVCGDKSYAITMELLPASSNICGMKITIDDGTTVTTKTVTFEGPIPEWLHNGAVCDGNSQRMDLQQWEIVDCPLGPGCVPFHAYSTFIAVEYTLPGGPLGDYRLSFVAQPCGAYCGLPVYNACCGCDPIPRDLMLSITSTCESLDGIEIALTWDGCLYWRGNIVSPLDGRKYFFYLLCNPTTWDLFYTSAVDYPAIFDFGIPSTAICRPVSLTWNASTHNTDLLSRLAFPICNPFAHDTTSLEIVAA